MRCSVGSLALALVALAGTGASAGSRSPVAWSPEGGWIAYVVETPAVPTPLDTAWIFRGRDGASTSVVPAGAATPRHRLWASRVGSDAPSVLFEDSAGPITAPAWRNDGKALAFGRVVPGSVGLGRYEVIRVDGTGRRVLSSQPLQDPVAEAPGLVASALAWSPDGRFLAAPRVGPAGLVVLRTENGTVVKSIESASMPAWAPVGNRLYYAVDLGPGRTAIECLDGPLGPTRRLDEVGRVECPPLPGRDGHSVVFLGRTSILLGDGTQPARLELQRVRIGDPRRERVVSPMREAVLPALGAPLVTIDRGVLTASLAQDRDGENLFSAVALPDRPCQVAWLRPRERSVFKLFPVFDPTVILGDLSLSPDGRTLALRLGESGPTAPAVLCDLDSMSLTPLAPDEPARVAWLSLALGTLRPILRGGLPPAVLGGRAIDRAVALPLPGELESNSETLARLRRVARTARPLLDAMSSGEGSLDRAEARFLLDALREDFPAALADLDRLAEIEPTPDRRLAVVGLRGLIFAGMGDLDRARDAFAYLRSLEPNRSRRTIEDSARGPVISEPTSPDPGWADYALARIDLLSAEAGKEQEIERLFRDHSNPDAPVPGLGLDLDPVPRPAMPEPPPPPGFRLRRDALPLPR